MITVGRIAFSFKSASCQIHNLNSENIWILVNLRSLEPGQGHASELMQQICKWADENKIDLYLFAQSSGDPRLGVLNNHQLSTFYRKYGFERDPNYMERERPGRLVRFWYKYQDVTYVPRNKNTPYNETP